MTAAQASAPDTGEFDRAMAEQNLAGLWNARVPSHRPEPAFLWPWQPVNDALMRASREIDIAFADRRVVKLCNPHLPSKAASRTIQFNFSIVNGGEVAPAHRHTLAAIRFVVRGRGAYTTVNGIRCEMEPGDLIYTPSWSWHDHYHRIDEPIVWLDGLDGPLVQALNLAFFEEYTQPAQTIEREADEAWRYPWQRAYAELCAINPADESPDDGAVLRYPELPTMACELRRLRPGLRTRQHRRTGVDLYHVVRGRGVTEVADQRIEWAAGDTFVVPAWQWQRHENAGADEAVLFAMSDRPVIKAMGLYREERR
ncbi:MAG: cupin domain-containing protein [Burkholderiaceae bacterium]